MTTAFYIAFIRTVTDQIFTLTRMRVDLPNDSYERFLLNLVYTGFIYTPNLDVTVGTYLFHKYRGITTDEIITFSELDSCAEVITRFTSGFDFVFHCDADTSPDDIKTSLGDINKLVCQRLSQSEPL